MKRGGGGGVSYVCGSVKMMRMLFHRGHLSLEKVNTRIVLVVVYVCGLECSRVSR